MELANSQCNKMHHERRVRTWRYKAYRLSIPPVYLVFPVPTRSVILCRPRKSRANATGQTNPNSDFFCRRWISTSTPDVAFASDDIFKITSRKVQNQPTGSDHKPVLLAVKMNYKPSNRKTFPRWNYSKGDWVKFATISDKLCNSVKCDDSNVNRACKNFNKANLEAANRSIPRGARRKYRPYWTEELQELENEVTNYSEQVECSPTLNNNIALKASTARRRKAFNKSARTSWKQKTESLNLDKDRQKLWKLTEAMNEEDTKQIPIGIERGRRGAANCFIDTYEEVSTPRFLMKGNGNPQGNQKISTSAKPT